MSSAITIRVLCSAVVAVAACRSSSSAGGADAGADAGADGLPAGFERPFDPSILGWGLDVVGRDAADIYVAGGTPDAGTLLHFDGKSWKPEDIPSGTPLLNWVRLFGDGQAVVVGEHGTVLWNDGSGWKGQDAPTDQNLWGVWGATTDDVWAVGGAGREAGQATVLHYDGTTWAAADVPTLQRPGVNAFFKVWGADASHVWIVGQNGAILRWDGSALTEESAGTTEDLISLWGSGSDDVVAVGGRSNGVIAHWDGNQWTSQSLAPAPGFNGVWMPGRGEFWVAGVRGLLRRGSVTTDGFDLPRTSSLSESDLHSVFGVDGYGLVSVGGNFDTNSGPFEGVAVRKRKDWQ